MGHKPASRPGFSVPGSNFNTPLQGRAVRGGHLAKTPIRGPKDAVDKGNTHMFAVLKTGGKQYKVQAGDILRIEKLAADAGETIQFDEILMLGGDAPVVGAPLVDGAAVKAEVIDQIKGEKLIHFVKRRRKHSSKRTKGHRQKLTLIKITEILASGATKVAPKAAAKAAPKAAPAAAAGADDLTQLTGVGPAAAKKLNEAGLTSFAQMAALSDDDIAGIDAVKVKPEWVAQAKDLAKG